MWEWYETNTNTACVQNADFLILQLVVRIFTTGIYMVKTRRYDKVILDQDCCTAEDVMLYECETAQNSL